MRWFWMSPIVGCADPPSRSVPEHTSLPAAEPTAVQEHSAHLTDGEHSSSRVEAPAAQPEAAPSPPPVAVKAEPKPEPVPAPVSAPPAAGVHRLDLTARDERMAAAPAPAAAATAAAQAQADAEFERLFDEPLVNGHGGGDATPAAARSRVEDDLQSAIKSILNLPRTDEPAAMLPPPLPPSRFNINASFFNADGASEDSEALDEAVRSILL